MKNSNKTQTQKTSKREGIPYGRFSSERQEEGNSQNRQGNAFDMICRIHNLAPSVVHAYFDKGKSGFHGKHIAEGGELRRFLNDAKSGKFSPNADGDMPVLCIEACDRLSRLEPMKTINLAQEILNAGFAIAIMEGNLFLTAESINDAGQWILFSVMIQQAHEYSKRLSRRMLSSWDGRRKEGKPITTVCPSWIIATEEGFKLYNASEDGERKGKVDSKLMLEACRMSIAGHGLTAIIRKLGVEGVKEWANLSGKFRERTLLGEFQPRNRKGGVREEAGEVRMNYYPALLNETEWYQLQESLNSRVNHTGKSVGGYQGKDVANLFPMCCYTDGVKMVKTETSRGKGVLKPAFGKRIAGHSYPQVDHATLEFGLLGAFSQITPAMLYPTNGNEVEDRISSIEGKLAVNAGKIGEIEEAILESPGSIKFFVRSIEALNAEKETLMVQREEAKAEQANAGADVLSVGNDIINHLEGLTGNELIEARMKLKTIIRQTIKSVLVDVKEGGRLLGLTVVLVSGLIVRTGEVLKAGPITVAIAEEQAA